MLKRLLFMVAFLASITGYSQGTNAVWHTDFTKAVEIATKENKAILMFFTGSDWCGWCKKIQKEVFVQKAFGDWAKKNVVLVELDFPRRVAQSDAIKQQNANLAQQLGVQGYPTIYFVQSLKKTGKTELAVLGSLGYQPGGPSSFITSANTVLKNKK